MALEVPALDLHYLIEEMKFLEGSKVDKISQPKKQEVVFQFYVRSKGKKLLRILLPSIVYSAEEKPEIPEKLFGFCSALRKYLQNSRLESIEQVGSERIVRFLFRKEEEYIVIVELFAKGNIILCKKDMAIIVPLNASRFKDRQIKAGAKYRYPEKKTNFFELTKKNLNGIIKKSNQTISKTLAVDFGFGGIYAKELCLISGIGPAEKTLTEKQLNSLLKSIKSITSKKINPFIIYPENKPIPFELKTYEQSTKKPMKTFGSAVEFAVNAGVKKPLTKQQKEMQKMHRIISKQEAKIKELQALAGESQKKGELIYEKYQLLNEVLGEIRKARKKYSWKEIKQKLKEHKLVKEVDEKKGEIAVEF